MKNAAHQYEDKLLEFAYGELARPEADAVEAHVRGCAKCSQQLSEIKGVRATMSALPMVAAPDAGLESLMAFAEQAAKRNAEGQVKPAFWKRYLAPLMTVMALAVVGVIGLQAKDEFDTNPASVAADAKLEQAAKSKAAEAEGKKNDAPMAAVAPVAQPSQPVSEQAPNELEAQKEVEGLVQPKPALAKKPMGKVGLEDLVTKGGLDTNKQGGGYDSSQASPVPESATRRVKSKKVAPAKDQEALAEGDASGEVLRQDYGNARGGYVQSKDGKRDQVAQKNQVAPKPAPAEAPAQVWAPPPPPPANEKSADKLSFGLGTSTPGGGSSSLGSSNSAPAPVVAAEPKAEPVYKEERKRVAANDDLDSTYGPTTPRPTAKTSAPSAPPAPSAAPPSKKSSYSLSPMASSSGSGRSMEDEAVKVQREEARAALDDDSKLVVQQRGQFRVDALSSMREASNRGDRTQEVQMGLKVLNMGATGAERAEALKHVCDAYDAMGEPESADPFCRQLIKEFAGTTAAKIVSERRSTQRAAPAKKPTSLERERKAAEADSADEKKPADAPASAY